MGDFKLCDISKRTILQWIEWSNEKGTAASTTKEAFLVLRGSLTFAVDLDYIASNPCEGMAKRLPKPKPKRVRPDLSGEQVLELADRVGTYRPLVLAMGVLGLRPSEAIGLHAGDVEDGSLVIRRSVTLAGGKMRVRQGTKNDKPRSVPLSILKADEFESAARFEEA